MLTKKVIKNSKTSQEGSNSSTNRINIEIKKQNGQTEVKIRKNLAPCIVGRLATCHHCTLAAAGQRVCDTCSNPVNKLAVRNLDFTENIGVYSSLEARLRECFRKRDQGYTLKTI